MSAFGDAVATFDRVLDDRFEPLRGNRVADEVFAAASHLGDWSLVWLMVGAAQALRSEHDARRWPRITAVIVAESVIVNQGLKRIFRRTRPTDRPDAAQGLREPRTSSFPSGHASAAACAAVLFSEGDPTLRRLVIPVGVIVATSRIHTRMHHPSDVAAGAIVGCLIGKTAVRWWPMPHRSHGIPGN